MAELDSRNAAHGTWYPKAMWQYLAILEYEAMINDSPSSRHPRHIARNTTALGPRQHLQQLIHGPGPRKPRPPKGSCGCGGGGSFWPATTPCSQGACRYLGYVMYLALCGAISRYRSLSVRVPRLQVYFCYPVCLHVKVYLCPVHRITSNLSAAWVRQPIRWRDAHQMKQKKRRTNKHTKKKPIYANFGPAREATKTDGRREVQKY